MYVFTSAQVESALANTGTLLLANTTGTGQDFQFSGGLKGDGGHVAFEGSGRDTLKLGSLSGSQAFTMNINLAAGTSDRIAIAGEASGTHTVHFILQGGIPSSPSFIHDMITWDSLAEDSNAATLFTGTLDAGFTPTALNSTPQVMDTTCRRRATTTWAAYCSMCLAA